MEFPQTIPRSFFATILVNANKNILTAQDLHQLSQRLSPWPTNHLFIVNIRGNENLLIVRISTTWFLVVAY